MYQPRAFVETDPAQLDALFAADPFITLVTQDAAGAPFASHLPVLYRRDGDHLRIEGHWARPNPQASHTGEALLIVHGPHAYVSPGWYPDKESAGRVPTWNYAIAHLRGRLEPFADETSLADLVSRLSRHFEAANGSDWEFDPADARQRALLRGIVGFRFVPEKIEMKFKLSQNHPLANRHAVIEALSARDDTDARAVAALMRGTLP
ncbi:MAG TPA: FMN-binding negative transcriptional regulator [Thermomonas sp.]|nr:FMN-binding negative transcriptional regulator [Thermomonas sp.]